MPGASSIAAGPAPEMVIDVDTSTVWALPDPRSWRGRHPLPTVVVLALAVLAVLTGPNLLHSDTLTLAWQVPTSTRFFWLTADAVYSLDDLGGGTVALSAHEPGNQRIVWSLPLRGPLAAAYATPNPLFASDLPPSSAAGVRTMITDENSAVTYPAAAMPLVYLTDDLIITVDRDPAVAAPSGAGGSLNGLEWTHVVTVRDLRTRAVLWTRRLAPGVRWALPGVTAGSAGIVGLPIGADWLTTYSVDGAVEVRDLHTGAIRASRAVGSLAGLAFVTALPDTVVVSKPTDSGDSVLTGYDPRTLEPLWQLVPPLAAAEPIACDPNLCLLSHRAVWIIDPRTAVVTAQILGTEIRPGPAGAAVVAPYGQNTAVIATDTGLNQPLDGVWRMIDATAYGPQAVVVQIHPLGRADIGLLDVLHARITVLGQANQWSAYYSCLAVDRNIACDDGIRLTVWRRGTSI